MRAYSSFKIPPRNSFLKYSSIFSSGNAASDFCAAASSSALLFASAPFFANTAFSSLYCILHLLSSASRSESVLTVGCMPSISAQRLCNLSISPSKSLSESCKDAASSFSLSAPAQSVSFALSSLSDNILRSQSSALSAFSHARSHSASTGRNFASSSNAPLRFSSAESRSTAAT